MGGTTSATEKIELRKEKWFRSAIALASANGGNYIIENIVVCGIDFGGNVQGGIQLLGKESMAESNARWIFEDTVKRHMSAKDANRFIQDTRKIVMEDVRIMNATVEDPCK